MRAMLALLLLALPSFAVAEEAVVVLRLSVEVEGFETSVEQAKLSRSWFASWSANRSELRDVTLQPLTPDGRPGPARVFGDCTLNSTSGIEGEGGNVVRSLRLSCRN